METMELLAADVRTYRCSHRRARSSLWGFEFGCLDCLTLTHIVAYAGIFSHFSFKVYHIKSTYFQMLLKYRQQIDVVELELE